MSLDLSSSDFFTPINSKDGSSSDSDIIERFGKRFRLNLDKDWSYREQKLHILKKFLDGNIYNGLSPFYIEFSGGDSKGKYIALAKRRPSVTYNLNKIIVDESVSMLFGLDHFPTIRCKENEDAQKFLQYVTRVGKLKRVMLEAAKIGSIGSVCIIVKVLEGDFYFEVLGTKDLMPVFSKMEPEKLVKLTQKRKVDGSSLVSHGYVIKKEERNKFFFAIREWNEKEEIFYQPYLCEKDDDEDFSPVKDEEKTAVHNLGFLPGVWIKNLPCSQNIDGACTFEGILDITVEIDYQLSQEGRLLKYNSDPTLVIKNPSAMDGAQLIKSIGVINLDEKGDAYYAEITGKSTEAVEKYVEKLREYALEVVRGNRSSPEKLKSAQSGKALEMLNSALIGLVGEMQITYGDDGLMKIYEMVLDFLNDKSVEINFGDYDPGDISNCKDHLTLDWPDWYPKSSLEELQEAQTLTAYKDGGLLSTETAVNSIADEYNILDVQKELKDIESEKKLEYTLTSSSSSLNNKVVSNGKRGSLPKN